MRKYLSSPITIGVLAGAILSAVIFASCGGYSNSSNMGTVSTYFSDPPTCSAELSHVYVTVVKVEANVSSTSSSGWQTLVDLTSKPMQVDLMTLNPSGMANFCGTLFLLGKTTLPPGTYQQIRLILLSNTPASGSATPASNNCGTGFYNCVVPAGSTSTVGLQLPSEAQTGIKIPSSQISTGGLTVNANQSVDLNINFDSCASIVHTGNGGYLLKPVLHAGEVSLNTNTISGTVVEAAGSGSPNPGAPVPNAIVLLEQPQTEGSATVDEVIPGGAATTDANGKFAFCPITSGGTNFDVVVTGQTTQTVSGVASTTTYNPSVVFGVPIGASTQGIPLFAETTVGSGTGLVSTSPGSISGQITSAASSTTAVAGSVELLALQAATNGSTTVEVTVPVFSASATPTTDVTNSQPPIYTTDTATSSTGGCATSTVDCVSYTLVAPASTIAAGVYSSSTGNNVTFPASGSSSSASYTLGAIVDGSNGLLTCSPTSVLTAVSSPVTPGGATTGPNFALTGCVAP